MKKKRQSLSRSTIVKPSNPRRSLSKIQQVSTPSQILHCAKFSKTSDHHAGKQIDDDPFLLLSQAKDWLQAERERYGQNPRMLSSRTLTSTYSPFNSPDGQIPDKAYSEAFVEFSRRFLGTADDGDDRSTPSVLLVATNVTENWTPPEAAGKGRFLFFPEIEDKGESALFLTYMRGPEHGAVDLILNEQLGTWRRSNDTLKNCLTGGLSSGGVAVNNKRHRGFEPDLRIFPKKKYRDLGGADSDGSNKGCPYSRFIWEMEYENRDPVHIRQRGELYMRPEYTRLFLAGKFYAPSEDGTYKAAVVLWGKQNDSNDTVVVMDAVSFGTEDLSKDNKNEFFEARADRLVGVGIDRWRRPQEEDVPSWNVPVPFGGFLYKVAKKKRKRTETSLYVLDEIDEDSQVDFTVDLRELASEYEEFVTSEESSSESDDN